MPRWIAPQSIGYCRSVWHFNPVRSNRRSNCRCLIQPHIVVGYAAGDSSGGAHALSQEGSCPTSAKGWAARQPKHCSAGRQLLQVMHDTQGKPACAAATSSTHTPLGAANVHQQKMAAWNSPSPATPSTLHTPFLHALTTGKTVLDCGCTNGRMWCAAATSAATAH